MGDEKTDTSNHIFGVTKPHLQENEESIKEAMEKKEKAGTEGMKRKADEQ